MDLHLLGEAAPLPVEPQPLSSSCVHSATARDVRAGGEASLMGGHLAHWGFSSLCGLKSRLTSL